MLRALIFFCLIGVNFAYANSWEKISETLSVKYSLPEHWGSEKDFLGIPVLITGPYVEGTRVTLSIVPTKANNVDFTKVDSEKEFEEYKKGREEFSNKYFAKTLEFLKPTSSKLKNGNTYISVGHVYDLHGKVYKEKAFFLGCHGKVIYLKSLYRVPEIKDQDSNIEKIIDSIDCKFSGEES